MNRIISVVGTRPNFIKIDPDIKHDILHTGQHYDDPMSAVFFRELGIPEPKWNLGCPNENFGEMLSKLFVVLKEAKPPLVMVYGDTNSSVAGAIAAYQLKIPLAHVEAGLRSGDMAMVEENNRIIIDHVAKFNYVPTLNALRNLQDEGIYTGVLTGDVMFDRIKIHLPPNIKKKKYYLMTLHRQENVDNKETLEKIMQAVGMTKVQTLFYCHPRTQARLSRFLISIPSNVVFKSPAGYLEMITAEAEAEKIITDSGGVQKEAFFVKTPCITLRSSTEWPETISAGWNVLCDPDKNSVAEMAAKIRDWRYSGEDTRPFGDGTAWMKIREHLQRNGYEV